jgi:hypothetical protein
MDYKTLDELNGLIEKELRKMVDKGDLSANELQAAEKAVCLMEKIIGLEEGTYSQASYGRSYGYMNHMDRMMDDASYERGRSPRTGRYVSRDGSYNYSMNRGYSGHSIGDRAVDKLESMMDEAGSDYEREVIRKYISMIRSDER